MDGLGSRVRHRGTRGVSVVDALMVYIKKAGQVSLFKPPQKKRGGVYTSGAAGGWWYPVVVRLPNNPEQLSVHLCSLLRRFTRLAVDP